MARRRVSSAKSRALLCFVRLRGWGICFASLVWCMLYTIYCTAYYKQPGPFVNSLCWLYVNFCGNSYDTVQTQALCSSNRHRHFLNHKKHTLEHFCIDPPAKPLVVPLERWFGIGCRNCLKVFPHPTCSPSSYDRRLEMIRPRNLIASRLLSCRYSPLAFSLAQ